MSKAVSDARDSMRTRVKELSAALKKIKIWKKKAAAFDRMSKSKSKSKSKSRSKKKSRGRRRGR